MDRRLFFTLLNFFFLFGFLFLVYLILAPFLDTLGWAGVIGIATYPLYRRLRNRFPGRDTIAASIMTPLVVMTLVVPFVLFIFILGGEVSQVYQHLEKVTAAGGSDVDRVGHPRQPSHGDVGDPAAGIRRADVPPLQPMQRGRVELRLDSVRGNFLSANAFGLAADTRKSWADGLTNQDADQRGQHSQLSHGNPPRDRNFLFHPAAVKNPVPPCPVPYDVTSRKKLLPFSGNVRALLF